MENESITEKFFEGLFLRQRLSEPEKVYNAIKELEQVPYLEHIRFEIGELKLNKAEIGLILTADYTGDKTLGGETIKNTDEVITPSPEIRQNVSEIFVDLGKRTGLTFKGYDGHMTENKCMTYLVFGSDNEERLDFVLMKKEE